jgi:TonB family protein
VSNVCQAEELDQPLAAVQAETKLNPASASAPAGSAGFVVIDFYVDEQGQPRMPVVLNSPPAALAAAAVGVLQQCRFNAPTRGGKPVLVRAQQKFVFTQSS